MFSLPEYTQRLRSDLRQTRIHNEQLKRAHATQKKKTEDIEEENKRLRKENEDLKKENGKLKEVIEKLTKTNERYRVALFDHGNFKNPDRKGERKKGGQFGHANTNTDLKRNYQSFPRKKIFANTCGGCGNPLSHTTSFKEKVLIDIQVNTQVLQCILESERQWCKNCHTEIRASHEQSLPFTEFGINTFMVVMHLRFKGKQSIRTIAVTLSSLFGLSISKSGVLSLLFQAKEYLGQKYEELKQAVRNGEVMYNDETGWSVRGHYACMWIMATNDEKQADGEVKAGITVYVAAESKGKGIFEEMYGSSKSYSMHDGNPSYRATTGEDKSLYCWSHVLRFAHEETVKLAKTHPACAIKKRLVFLYQTVRSHPGWKKEQKEKILRHELDSILAITSDDQTVVNIQYRIKTQKEGLILALLITDDGTNNLGEREFRPLTIIRNISYGSDTYGGMEVTAMLASIVQTIHRDKTKVYFPTLTSYLREGVQKKYPRYKHIPIHDI
jgi:transposase IS66 family protein